jgi:hypothetical protein
LPTLKFKELQVAPRKLLNTLLDRCFPVARELDQRQHLIISRLKGIRLEIVKTVSWRLWRSFTALKLGVNEKGV